MTLFIVKAIKLGVGVKKTLITLVSKNAVATRRRFLTV